MTPFSYSILLPEFRAKSLESGNWEYGSLVLPSQEMPSTMIVNSSTHIVDELTVSQYCHRNYDTGDKVFSGDVVSGKCTDARFNGIGVVMWYPACGWCVCLIKTGQKHPLGDYNNLKKLGNVWKTSKHIPQGTAIHIFKN